MENRKHLPTPSPDSTRLLSNADFARLAEVPPEVGWFANIDNQQTRRAYKNALKDFMTFTGIKKPEEFREVNRAHIIAWRDELVSRTLIKCNDYSPSLSRPLLFV